MRICRFAYEIICDFSALSLVVLLLLAGCGPTRCKSGAVQITSEPRRPELAYYETVNRIGPPQDPQLLYLLMAHHSNSNAQATGVEFFSARLKEFGPLLTDVQKALYLSAIGLLRAQNASNVSLIHRIGQGHDIDAGSGKATFRRQDFCCQLDCRCSGSRAPQLLWPAAGGTRGAYLVYRECRQGAAGWLDAGSVLPSGQAGGR